MLSTTSPSRISPPSSPRRGPRRERVAPATSPAAEVTAVVVASPIGTIRLVGDAAALRAIDLPGTFDAASAAASRAVVASLPPDHPVAQAAAQLAEYFAGRRRAFDLPLAPAGTPFQQAVWAELARIPHGATISYAELAARVGRPGAFRAVGAANGRNPLPIVLPCHRVIASDGGLGGFGGGLAMKEALLRHEGAACVAPAS